MGETVMAMATMNYNVIHSAESSKYVDIYYVQQEVAASEINAAVYAVLCYVAEEVLKRSTCYISGERTAAELAGTVGKYCFPIAPLSENERHVQMAQEVQVRVGTWNCNFPTKDIFKMMAEWEGVMGLTAKQTCRFQCETKEDMPEGMELKAYKRWRGYRPKRISFANEEKRIAQKLEVIGKLSQELSDEGMKRAMSVLAVVKQLDKTVPYYYANVAEQVLLRKLWNDYGKKGGMGPMSYCERDFEYGPEIWKQVDEEYVKTLVEYFKAFMGANHAPEWVKEGCYVQFKNQENAPKKCRGKFYVEGLEVHVWSERVEWWVVIKVDRYKTEKHPVSRMEPCVEPDKPKTQKKVSPKSAPKREQSGTSSDYAEQGCTRPKVKSAPKSATRERNNEKSGGPAPLSLADRLRAALMARLAA